MIVRRKSVHMQIQVTFLSLIVFAQLFQELSAQTLTAPSMQWISPKENAQWSVGSQHYLLWRPSSDSSGVVGIRYSTDGGAHWVSVNDRIANTGRFLWQVPDSVSADCCIEIVPISKGRAVRTRFSITPSQEVRDYKWIRIADKAPYAPRDGAGALVFRDRMWMIGGWNPYDKVHFPRICNNEVWSSRDGIDWTLVKPNTFTGNRFNSIEDWEGRHTAGYVVYKSRLWIVGGDANQGHYHSDVWNSSDGLHWNLVNPGKPVPWTPRALHHTLVFNDKIWVIGGQTMPKIAPAVDVFYRDIWNTSDGVNWVRIRAQEPYWSARGMIGGNVVFKGSMWILGGGRYDTPKSPARQFYGDVWSSADGVRWTLQVQVPPWTPRQYHDVAVFDNRMWVLEGSDRPGVSLNDVWYSTDGLNWYELRNSPWMPRHAASVFVHDRGLWMLGGSDKGKMDSKVWKLVRED